MHLIYTNDYKSYQINGAIALFFIVSYCLLYFLDRLVDKLIEQYYYNSYLNVFFQISRYSKEQYLTSSYQQNDSKNVKVTIYNPFKYFSLYFRLVFNRRYVVIHLFLKCFIYSPLFFLSYQSSIALQPLMPPLALFDNQTIIYVLLALLLLQMLQVVPTTTPLRVPRFVAVITINVDDFVTIVLIVSIIVIRVRPISLYYQGQQSIII